jgi:hypothetical protein
VARPEDSAGHFQATQTDHFLEVLEGDFLSHLPAIQTGRSPEARVGDSADSFQAIQTDHSLEGQAGDSLEIRTGHSEAVLEQGAVRLCTFVVFIR